MHTFRRHQNLISDRIFYRDRTKSICQITFFLTVYYKTSKKTTTLSNLPILPQQQHDGNAFYQHAEAAHFLLTDWHQRQHL